MYSEEHGGSVDFIEAAIIILGFAILSVPIAVRFHIPLEIFLVIGSGLISFIPGLPTIEINPMIIFNLFLPPILFHAAYYTSWREFKINIRPISLLSIVLVIISAMVIAAFSKWLIPSFTWAQGFLLGAIVSPTDAASATAIIKKIGAPQRLISILEGESLINDATALILFRFALAAILVGSFSMVDAISKFFIMSIGGLIVGLGIGKIVLIISKRIKMPSAEITLSIITAFSCYIAAERLGVSGVIATVACGIYFGLALPEIASSKSRIQAKGTWNTMLFIINGFVFTLIGLELPNIVRHLEVYSLKTIFLYGISISLILILVRIIWVVIAAYLSRLMVPSIQKRDPFHFPTLFILGWSGMRGIVSLAAVLSLPYQIHGYVPFPNRDLILLLTYFVIFVTLIIPTFSLPFLLKYFGLTHTSNPFKEEAIARYQVLETVLHCIDDFVKTESFPENVVNEFRNQIERRMKVVSTQISDTPFSTLTDEYTALRKLLQMSFSIERKILLNLRKQGDISDHVFHLLLDELDFEEMRAKTLRI
jgi:CPA1 family monovalent cation:H+ antiporter